MDRYQECSKKVYEVLNRFTPKVEMASIDEAYLDMTGTERLFGPPLKAAHSLHVAMKTSTQLNCSIGIATSRVVAKITSDQAKPNGVLWVIPGSEAGFLAPLDVRKMPGVGKVTEKRLHDLGIRKIGDLAKLADGYLEEQFGQWGTAMAAKARGEDAGGWFDTEIGEDEGPKSISHEHTFSEDTRDESVLEATLLRLSEMVGRRLREHGLFARTLQLKLRYTDFSTITRAHTPKSPTQLDTEIYTEIRKLFRDNWKRGRTVRLLGVSTSHFEESEIGTAPGEQMDLLGPAPEDKQHQRWGQAMATADKLRDKFGDRSVVLGTSLKRNLRERIHENPTDLPGKKKGQ
jgi:DNA polymerase-4